MSINGGKLKRKVQERYSEWKEHRAEEKEYKQELKESERESYQAEERQQVTRRGKQRAVQQYTPPPQKPQRKGAAPGALRRKLESVGRYAEELGGTGSGRTGGTLDDFIGGGGGKKDRVMDFYGTSVKSNGMGLFVTEQKSRKKKTKKRKTKKRKRR